jgi:hypothetical protein
MLLARSLSETNLPKIAAILVRAAIDCSEKNSEGEGPPSFLMTELEEICTQYQYAQRKIDESGIFLELKPHGAQKVSKNIIYF